MPTTTMSITTRPTRTVSTPAGNPEPLVLVPGMMCDRRLWSPQIDALQHHCSSITVADTTSADSIHHTAKEVLADAAAHFALAGLSMGGLIAFEMWRQAPNRITRMALLDTNASAETADKRHSRENLLSRVSNGELRDVFVDSLKHHYLAECNRENSQLLELIMHMAMDLGEDVFSKQSRAVGNRLDSLATLETINVPTLVLCGEEDQLCPVSFHRLMAERIANARLVVLKDCGHLSTLEQADRVSEELLHWLDSE